MRKFFIFLTTSIFIIGLIGCSSVKQPADADRDKIAEQEEPKKTETKEEAQIDAENIKVDDLAGELALVDEAAAPQTHKLQKVKSIVASSEGYSRKAGTAMFLNTAAPMDLDVPRIEHNTEEYDIINVEEI